MPDIVRIGGTDLVRTREANGEFTYRPVDAQTGAVVDAATFEARKKAQRQAQLANDPRANERAANEWAAQTRAAIARTRVDESRRLKREDAQRRERESGTTGPRRRARELGASAKPSKVLTDLREEMRIAEATGLKKKNPGSYSFLKAALDVEEGKHARAVEAARKRDYAKARSRKGVKGDAGLDAELSSGDEDNAPRIRGSLADLDDPDYRRDARLTTAKAPTPTPTKATKAKGLCRRCKLPGHLARDCMTDEKDLPTANKSVVDAVASEIERLDVTGDVAPKAANIPKPRSAKHGASKNDDANDPDYAREPVSKKTSGRGGRGGRGGQQRLVVT